MVKKALTIDDNFNDCQEISGILNESGFQTSIATNGAQALDKLNDEGKFDLITLDIKMPTLSGSELLQLLKEKTNGRTKIIFVTIMPEKYIDLSSVDGYVRKPFDKESLLKEVTRVNKNT